MERVNLESHLLLCEPVSSAFYFMPSHCCCTVIFLRAIWLCYILALNPPTPPHTMDKEFKFLCVTHIVSEPSVHCLLIEPTVATTFHVTWTPGTSLAFLRLFLLPRWTCSSFFCSFPLMCLENPFPTSSAPVQKTQPVILDSPSHYTQYHLSTYPSSL